jgi:hypothetical protein
MSEECVERCKNAKPDSPCKCRCGGRFHGIKRVESEHPYDRTVNENMGGEVAEFIKKVKDQKFTCTCTKTFPVNQFMAYEHSGGLKDKDGKKWWVYVHCPHCSYDWSAWKLEARLDRQNKYEQLKVL